MTITKYQEQIIRQNPKLSIPQLSKLAGCSETTIKNYRRKLREQGKEPPTIGQNSGQESQGLPARDNIEQGDNSPDMYNPKELAADLSDLCRSELALYKVAESKIRTDGPDPKTVWDASQHFKNYVNGASNLAKWYGMEKLTLVSDKPQDITKERLDKMSMDDIEKMMKTCLE